MPFFVQKLKAAGINLKYPAGDCKIQENPARRRKMKYENLIFDFYGTLCEIRTEPDLPEAWDKLRLFYGYHGAVYSTLELREEFNNLISERNMKAGQSYEGFPDMPVEPVFESLFTNKGVSKDEAALLADTAAQVYRLASTVFIRLYPNAAEALEKLKKAGFKLYLLSNAQAAYTRRELKMLGIDGSFDKMYLSSDYGIRKPDPNFIGTLIRENNLKPENCLMIGNDMQSDIGGAKAAGIDGLFIRAGMELGKGRPDYEIKEKDWLKIAEYIIKIAE